MHYLLWLGGSLAGAMIGVAVGGYTGYRLGLLGGHQIANALTQRTRHDTPDA